MPAAFSHVPDAVRNSPEWRQFLAQHPELAGMKTSGDVNTFLQNHPKIAATWRSLVQPGVAAATPAAPPAPAPVATPAASADPTAASAKAAITSALDSYGLSGLGEWAWQQYLAGTPTEQIMLDLRKQPAYATRFPGMAELSKNGRAITESEYINLERSYAQQARAYGLPTGFYDDPTDFAKLIGGEVSAQEWGDRLAIAQQAALTSPEGQAMRDFLSREYGMPNAVGAVTAYWIDPKVGMDVIKKQAAAAQVAAEAAVTGFGSLGKTQAERLGDLGVTADQARQGFTQLASLHELNTGLAGDQGDQGVSKDTMVDAAFTGDAKAGETLQKAQRRRTAAFGGGGGFAAGQGGVSGLGSAAT